MLFSGSRLLAVFTIAAILGVLCPPDRLSAQSATLAGAKFAKQEFFVANKQYRAFEWILPHGGLQDDALTIMAVEATTGTYDFRILEVRQNGDIVGLLKSLQCENAVVVSNGGYYFRRPDGKGQPTGLAVSGGRIVAPLTNRRWGGFVTWDGNLLEVRRVEDVEIAQKSREALQSTPIVIWNEQVEIYSDDKAMHDRTTVGVTTSGGLAIVGAFRRSGRAVSFFSFAKLVKEMPSVGGPRIKMLLGLDGGPSAHMHIPALGKSFGYSGPNFLPTAVCVSSR